MKDLCEKLAQSISDWPEVESVAFLQGMLTGELCGASRLSVSDFVKGLLQDLDARQVKESFLAQLYALYERTLSGLESPECNLTLCLPDDSGLFERARDVAQWCEGFIYGFGMRRRDRDDLPDEAKEYLETVIEISHLDVDGLADAQPDESLVRQLEELVEFLRIGAIAAYEALHPASERKRDDRDGVTTAQREGDDMPPPRTVRLQ